MRVPEPRSVSFDRLGDAIDRPRLRAILDASAGASLTSVVAPAGWGKSVLLASWAGRTSPCAWVELSRADNDAGNLIRTLFEGLAQHLDATTREVAARIDHLTAAAVPARAEELAHGLRGHEHLTVVLDDVHILSDVTAVASAQRFVEAIPSGVRLVTAARHDPPFAVARLRVAGRLAEIRQRDLAFTAEEVEALLAEEGIRLDPDDLGMLIERTEGWGAAIRLALIAMHQTDEPSRVVQGLAGTDRVIAEYLMEEVLGDVRGAARDFLLRTSIVEEISGPLAGVLTDRADGGEVLDGLAGAGAFTTRLGDTGWYRYHPLLRGFLQLRLKVESDATFLDLHRTAADWFDANGRPVPAIEHAIAAGEIEAAANRIEAAVTPLVNAGRGQTVADLAKRVSESTPDPPLPVVLARMFALYSIGSEPEVIDQLLDTLIEAAESDRDLPSEGGDPRSMADPLPWLVGLRARKHGDLDTLLGLERPEHLPSPSGRVEAWIAEGAIWNEQFDRADEHLQVYRRHAERDLNVYPPSTLHALGLTAYSLVAQGRLWEAERVIGRARVLIDRLRTGHLAHTFYAQLAEAQSLWERGDLAGAESRLVEIQEHADRFGDVPVSAILAIVRSRNRSSLGDHAAAIRLLDAAAVLPTGRAVGGHFARRITIERCRLDVLAGDHEAMALLIPDRAARLAAADEPLRDQIVLARLTIALGEDHPAIDRLAAVDASLPAHRIDLALLRAARECARDGTDAATDALEVGMQIGTDAGMSQRLEDERRYFGPAFAAAATRTGLAADRRDPAAAVLVDPLTERELEVLAKLTTQMTYREIADELFVSPNTVKSHTAAIYRKLAVARRTDAVNRARELRLLPA